ncbi:MAG TPA: hypothetical protein VGE04_10480 [Chloroflexia bacterium]|jgi:hypothetical protein
MQLATTIKVTIPIVNNKSVQMPFVIQKGSILALDQPGMQNVVVADEVSVVLAPGERKEVTVEGYCLNRDLAWPNGATGKLTKYALGTPFAGQQDVWQTLSAPDLGTGIKFKELRFEMLDRITSHDKLRLIARDIGFVYDDLRGDTLTDKCANLIEACHEYGVMDELIARLREEYPRGTVFTNWAATYAA